MNTEELITAGGLVSGQASPISMVDLLIALTVSFLIGIWLAFVYARTHRGMTYERSFVVTLIMIAPIISLIIMLIGSNLALSLGMVGALSIIRFRNVIKDPRDMIYLFWGIAAGLGAGTYNWNIVVVASLMLGGALFLLHYFRYGSSNHQDCVFVINGTDESPRDQLFNVLSKSTLSCEIRSADVTDEGWELVFEARFSTRESAKLTSILDEIKSHPGVRSASLLAPHLSLPV